MQNKRERGRKFQRDYSHKNFIQGSSLDPERGQLCTKL